jgi:diaminobutyrate-2-oxoglutarate transaminase
VNVFEALEFHRARGARLYSEQGRPYLDFFAGAGALNYGHNEPAQKQALLDYLADDGVTHALDMFTTAKRDFLETFDELILRPRGTEYKVVFPGPGGTNAVEAALKLARRVTGRPLVVGFTHGFHGMTLGALAVSGSARKRAAAGVPLTNVVSMPYDGYLGAGPPDLEYLGRQLSDPASGLDLPAAVIVETVQSEGGVNVARAEWLRGLAELCRRHGVLLIVDDIQVGCGRTGAFFSYEDAGIVPDMVCLSKSIGGYGLPLALTLIRPELDVWQPGDHNGTFRGISPAFVAGAQALRTYWSDDVLEKSTRAKGERVGAALQRTADAFPEAGLKARGRGLIWGLDLAAAGPPQLAAEVCAAAFEQGLLVETSGARDEVIKLLPPLTIDDDDLDEGLRIIDHCVGEVLRRPGRAEEPAP